MSDFKVLHGLKEKLPENRNSNYIYYTTDTNEMYIGEMKILNQEETEDLVQVTSGAIISKIGTEVLKTTAQTINGAINELHDGITPSSSNNGLTSNMKKSMIQYYKHLSSTDPTQKEYFNNIIASVKEMDEFAKLGTGLFIHWGVYSVPAGHYEGINAKGQSVNANINYNCEWSMRDLSIPMDVYKNYENQFTGENFDTEEIAKMAYECGMKYIVITVKHHEGFTLYPTSYGYWDIRTSACRNTVLDELKASCEKYGLKFGVYFSQYWDWMGEGGFGLEYQGKWNGSSTDLYTEEQHLQYCKDMVKEIKECVEKYDPYLIWYDPGTNYNTKYINIFLSGETQYYPQFITNDRLDYNRTYGDYGTGERTIYVRNKLNFGESCFTLNNTWGYSVNNDNRYYVDETIFKQFLLYTLSYGQNCLLNIGPKPDGSIPEKQIEKIGVVKSFVNKYGGFYDYKSVNRVSRPKWGYMLQLPNNKIMCYVFTKSNKDYSNVTIDCVSTKNLESVDILTPSADATYSIENNRIIIQGLELDANAKVGVIRLNYSSEPLIIDANLLTVNEFLPSRTFVMAQNLTFDFIELIYTTTASGKRTHSTEFIWDGDSRNCTATLDFTTTGTVDTTTLVVTDVETNSATTLTFANTAKETTDLVALENGKRYHLDLKFSGTDSSQIKISGLTFSYFENVHVTGVTLDKSLLEIKEGETSQLVATVMPEDADDKTVTWASDDETIATVSNGIVEGIAEGFASVTVTTVDGSYTASCEIEVTKNETPVTGVSLDKTSINLTPGFSEQLTATVLPTDAHDKSVTWSISDEDIASVVDGLVFAKTSGSATVTVTTVDGSYTASCEVTVGEETYDYLFEALSLDGDADQGDDTGIKLFSNDMQNWTMFGYAYSSLNSGQTDNNATLYQCVVNASPWTGLRIDADNNNYPTGTTEQAVMIPRFLAGTDNYINPTNGNATSSKPKVSITDDRHPVCFSREGDVYTYTIDGVNWYTLTGLTSAQISRLADCILTVGFDYKRQSGAITTTKYRFLKTDHPCCVSIKNVSNYPFYTLYHKYDSTLTD